MYIGLSLYLVVGAGVVKLGPVVKYATATCPATGGDRGPGPHFLQQVHT
jgi:hypothetical protein